MSATLWHRFQTKAVARGDAVAIRHGAQVVNFADLIALAGAWAQILPAAPGDRVVIAAHNSIDLAAAVPGIWARGAIPVLVNADAPDTHLLHALRQTDAVAVLVDPGRNVVGSDAAVFALQRLEPANVGRVPNQNGQVPGSIVYTSGSTGAPKGVVQASDTLAGGVDRVAAAIGFRDSDSILCPIPFAFDYGWGQLLSLLLAGLPLVLPEPRGAAGICGAIATHRPTILAGVPAVFADLLTGLAPISDIDRSSIRLITNTGSRIPDLVFQRLTETFPQAQLSLNYGLTETYRSATLPLDMAASHPTSVGFALPGAALVVLRPDGNEADPDEEGEIVHRGAGAFLGYWNDPERTAQVLRPDPLWPDPAQPAPLVVFTGDLGHKDAEGRLHIHGRRDRQIKSMGVRVSPDEVEGLLLASGIVREVAVVTRPNDTLGSLIVAVVSLPQGAEEGPALKALKRHARETMSPYMQPRDYLVLSALPRNPSAKIDYLILTRLVAPKGGRHG
jgi:acyl-coenzyme A synthetase/AMP-(fatty) acid ligase